MRKQEWDQSERAMLFLFTVIGHPLCRILGPGSRLLITHLNAAVNGTVTDWLVNPTPSSRANTKQTGHGVQLVDAFLACTKPWMGLVILGQGL